MASVFITGSSDGLGLMAANLLIGQGHQVVLHGRNERRSEDARKAAPGCKGAISATFPPLLAQSRSRPRRTRWGVSTP